jgi:prevent-host-death family protein
MKRQIAAGEFKAKCLHILDEVQQTRREVVITKRGRAVARLLPVGEPVPSVFGRMRGSIEILGDIVAPVGEPWEADE